jgi:WD40 repeat protein
MKILERRLIASLILLVLSSLTALGQQTETARLMHHEGVITSVAFNTDGQTLASGSLDGSIIFWNARTRQHLRRIGRVSDILISIERCDA